MKQFLKLRIKPIYLILVFIFVAVTQTASVRNNPYAGDSSIRHSLYAEKDNQERMSVYPHGIPEPREESENSGEEKLSKSSELVAKRIVNHYKKIFDYLDYKPVDNLLTAEELAEAFRDFDWPKITTSIGDDVEYAKYLVQMHDTSQKNGLNFVEFCKLLEELWDSADFLKEEKCNVAFDKSKDIFIKLYKWLDRDRDGLLEAEDLIYGVSRIMIRDVDLQEIQDFFAKYQKDGKINENNFLLAVINGELSKTFKDELVTSTFIK